MSTIKETTLHPDGNEGVDLYPKTNINQVDGLPQKLTSVENQINQLNIDKLTKPTNPTAESAVTMLADGTVGTKPLSEFGGSGGKLYMHRVSFVFENGAMYVLTIDIPTNTTDAIVVDFLKNYIQGYCVVNYNGSSGIGAVSLYYASGTGVVISGSVCDLNANNNVNITYGNKDGLVINSQILIEL